MECIKDIAVLLTVALFVIVVMYVPFSFVTLNWLWWEGDSALNLRLYFTAAVTVAYIIIIKRMVN